MWKEVSEQRYDEMLGILPPALMLGYGFLVGEPHDHRVCNVRGTVSPSFAAFASIGGKFYEGPTMTTAEFRRLDIATVSGGGHARPHP